ncbi:MAG: hypothetical protein HKM24_02695 [Gammaproteobacteria bacterium]|nr:hypothetical protein [Gammaproteobacteria bacterium]
MIGQIKIEQQRRSEMTNLAAMKQPLVSANAEPWLNDNVMDEIADLNAAFLRLVVTLEGLAPAVCQRILGLPRVEAQRIAELTSSRFRSMCRCPYSLFSLQLDDRRAWETMARGLMPLPYQQRPQWYNQEHSQLNDEKISAFMLTALHYIRHLVLSGTTSAQFVFGIVGGNSTTLARIPVSKLQNIAHQCFGLLSVRFANNPFFWKQLTKNAAIGNDDKLHVAQISGLHLISSHPQNAAA